MTKPPNDAIELLRRRLAAGEITAEEFDRIKERLADDAAEAATPAQPAAEEEASRTTGTSSSLVIRFLTGRLTLSASFVIFAIVFAVLLGNQGAIGRWWGGMASATGLPVMLHVHVMMLIGLLTIFGTGAAAWRRMGSWDRTGIGALAVFVIVIFLGAPFLYGYFR